MSEQEAREFIADLTMKELEQLKQLLKRFKVTGRIRKVPKDLDLVGMRFGKLLVVEFVKLENHRKWWKCKCECGNEIITRTDQLRTGNTKSCGCSRSETTKGKPKKHGYAGTRLYRIWKGIKSRCYCKGSTDYKWYGALGVKVCDEWQTFEPFCEWALSNGYTEELTIDRVDVTGDYEPKNCRWATISEQNFNRRDSKKNQTER